MPNWCNNNISITGPNSVIDKIEKIVKEDDSHKEKGLLNFFHPLIHYGLKRMVVFAVFSHLSFL